MTELESALRDDPQGIICYDCGKVNHFFDDVGFFYALKHDQQRAMCEACFKKNGGQTGDR